MMDNTKKGDMIMSGDGISVVESDATIKLLSVGEEFTEWAEKYWALNTVYNLPESAGAEAAPYSHIKDIFISKIDEIIKERLSI